MHANIQHLIANSFAFFFLLFLSLSLDKKRTALALIIIIILGGGAVWLFASPHTIHIGASGIIFGLLGFLLFTGIFRREWKALVFSALVFLLYGGLLVTLLIHKPGISWSGHFFGFGAGVVAAWITRPVKVR
ncbi:MAG: rhomboid family intramembrane serine protease [Deltaproteobacteria bacterium]|nr:rhomboid family intramembrane serine protease [Deltaproteobacteria bacterium]